MASGAIPSQAFQPLSAKNFLSLKTTAKPVPRPPPPGASPSAAAAAAVSAAVATSSVDHSGHNRRVFGGGGGNKRSNHSHDHNHNSHARGGRNATTTSHQPSSSSSDHAGHQSKSYLDTADLLANLPHQQQQQQHNHHLTVSDHSISSIIIDPNRNHESSISNIIREHDLAVLEDHRQQQQQRGRSSPQQPSTRRQSSSDHNPKHQKVRFEHLHQSCPVIGDGIDKYHLQRAQQRETAYYRKSPIATGSNPGDDNGAEGMVMMTKSSNHSEPGESSPRSTRSKDLLNVGSTRFDLAHVSRRGICLANLPFKSALQQTLLLRREQRQLSKDAAIDFVVESMHGDKLASIDSRVAVPGAPEETWERTILDTDGNEYAVIVENVVDGGLHRFKICGTEPMFSSQKKSRDSGLFTYAEVKNSGGIGMKFTMKVRGHNPPTKYVTESFGPSIFQWGRRGQGRRAKGFTIKMIDESDGKKRSEAGAEVARLTFLGAGKAISINPDQDFRLIIAFSAIIDEMVEKRLR